MNPLDQYESEFCTAYGEATDQGYRYGVDMSGEAQTAIESKYLGVPITQGADPIPSMQATLLDGSVPSINSPFSLKDKGNDFIADWSNWPILILSIGKNYLGGVPYEVDGPYDVFDNIRQALYQSWISGLKSCVKAFGFWYKSWNEQALNPINKGRVSLPQNESYVSRHRYNFIDWIPDGKGDFLLVAALTQGKEFGDNGVLYFDRETVNTEFANMLESGNGLYITRSRSYSGAGLRAWFNAILQFLISRLNKLTGKT